MKLLLRLVRKLLNEPDRLKRCHKLELLVDGRCGPDVTDCASLPICDHADFARWLASLKEP
jgi:hypothetical protein